MDNIIKDINYDIKYQMHITRISEFDKFEKTVDDINNIIINNQRLVTKDMLISIIKQELYLRAKNGDGLSYYIFDYKGNCILNSKNPSLENKNLLYLHGKKCNPIIKDLIEKAKYRGCGVTVQFWPNDWFSISKRSTSKKSFVFYKDFKQLGLIVVAVYPIDFIENRLQYKWLGRLALYRYGKNGHGYIFVIQLYNINGGKCFGRMLVNASNPSIVGKCLSD